MDAFSLLHKLSFSSLASPEMHDLKDNTLLIDIHQTPAPESRPQYFPMTKSFFLM